MTSANPSVHPSYYIFTDILGFSNMVKVAKVEGKSNELLNRLHKVICKRRAVLEELNEFCQIKGFSDNVVLGLPINSIDGEGEFGLAVLQILEYQLEMSIEGFFIRGAITKGDLYIDDNLIFGNSIIEAYNLENKVAKYPRIILSDDVLILIKQHLGYYSDPKYSPQEQVLCRDIDGHVFFNYLYATIDNDGILISEKLIQHKEKIIEKLSDPINKDFKEKYEWIKDYHNNFCNSISHILGYDDEYKIQ